MKTVSEIRITPNACILNKVQLQTQEHGKNLLKELYRESGIDYPKFYKMDGLCRLGFIASELLLAYLKEERFMQREDRAVVFVTRHGCITTDKHYEETIKPGEGYFPSPAVFVYTLPNIVTGEISIRNKYVGETSMYIIEEYNTNDINRIIEDTFTDSTTTSILIGWVDYVNDNEFETIVKLINK